MPFSSAEEPLVIPQCNLLSFLFADGRSESTEPQWIDAADTSRSLSLSETYKLAKRLALGLDDLGVPSGAVVLIFTPNHIYVPVIYYAVAGSKRVFTGANPDYAVYELTYQIKQVNAAVVLIHPSLFETGLAAAQANGVPDSHIFLLSDRPCETIDRIRDWSSLLVSESIAKSWNFDSLEGSIAAETIACINMSSGTTGLPKAVCITHTNIVATIMQISQLAFKNTQLTGSESASQRWIAAVPLNHTFGQTFMMGIPVVAQFKVYVLRKFVFEDYLRCIEKYKITALQLSPPGFIALQKNKIVADYDLSSVKHMFAGAGAISRELQKAISEKFHVKVDRGYGMTEMTCGAIGTPWAESDDESGTIGFIIANTEVKLVDDEGKEIDEEDKVGELLVRGPQIMRGYWNNPVATKESFDSDAFLRSGDLAVWRRDKDERVKWFLIDRKKELIKVSGTQVSPAELEAVLLECLHVADAAVVGIFARDDGEERPRAYVVLTEDAKQNAIGEEEIQQFVEGKLARWKWLEGGVKFMEKIPKLSSGKIMRKVMRDLAKKDAEEVRRERAGQAESTESVNSPVSGGWSAQRSVVKADGNLQTISATYRM